MRSADHSGGYPLAETLATRMLSAAVQRLQTATGRTQRELADTLGYKTSVVLSHMVRGRVPIPVERAESIARLVGLDPAGFLLATLQQRHPEIDFHALLGVTSPQQSALAAELESIGGVPLDQLPNATKRVLREAVASERPECRWVTGPELTIIELIREQADNAAEMAVPDKETSGVGAPNTSGREQRQSK